MNVVRTYGCARCPGRLRKRNRGECYERHAVFMAPVSERAIPPNCPGDANYLLRATLVTVIVLPFISPVTVTGLPAPFARSA